VRDIVTQMMRELTSGCCTLHQHDRHGVRGRALGDAEALVDESDLGAGGDPGIDHIEALDPDVGQRRFVYAQHGLQLREHFAGGLTGSSGAVRDHIEGARTESVTQ
jgi:hypothetical protein